jgi:hypothetical protein
LANAVLSGSVALELAQTCSNDSLRQWLAKPIGFSPLKLPLG